MSRGKSKRGIGVSGPQTWRDLAGPRRGRINSPQARKRRLAQWLKLVSGILGITLISAGVVALVRHQRATETTIQITPPSEAIDSILFNTNGVLPNSWLSSVVDLQPGTRMMDADIYNLKTSLEAVGQVKSAKVERVFPSSLQITIEERVPAMRIAVASAGGQTVQKIVSRDGKIYGGVGYPKNMLGKLPYLRPYQHSDGGFLPLIGIERVAELLELARTEMPKLYGTWRVVSLTHYSGDLELPGQVIEIRSNLVPQIIFGANSDYAQQLDRLEYILLYIQKRGNPSIERIDLSLRDAAAVQFTSGRISTF